MFRGGVWLGVALLALGACGSAGSYECVTADACDSAAGGVCEPSGYCSYADERCDSGRRFGQLAGAQRGECVALGSEVDGGAREPTPDAAPVEPDAACVVQLLGDPGFDLEDGGWLTWTTGTNPLVVAGSDALVHDEVTVDSPPNLARLGDNDVDSSLYRSFAVPAATTSLTVRGLLWVVTNETNPDVVYDLFVVTLFNEAVDTALEELGRYTNQDDQSAWQPFAFDTAATYAGQTINLIFFTDNDQGASTRFYVDSVSVEARVCP